MSGSPYIARATDGKNIGVDLDRPQERPGTSGSGVTTTNAAPTASPGGPYSGQPGARHRVQRQQFERLGRDDRARIDGTGVTARIRDRARRRRTPTRAAGTYTVRLTVTDNVGATGSATTTASVKAPTTSAGDIVLTAADVTVIRGGWARISSTSGSGGQIMSSADNGWSTEGRAARRARQLLRGAVHGGRKHQLPRVAAHARPGEQLEQRLGVGAVHRRGDLERRARCGARGQPAGWL